MGVFDQFAGQEVNINITMPTRDEVTISAQHVLYVLDGPGAPAKEPGGFITLLIQAACHADEQNLAQLALGFPAYATNVDIYKNMPGGTELLRRLASKTTDIQPDEGTSTPDTQPGDGSSPKGN